MSLIPGKLYTFSEMFYCFIDDKTSNQHFDQEHHYKLIAEIYDRNYWNIADINNVEELELNTRKQPCMFLGTKEICTRPYRSGNLTHENALLFLFCGQKILVDFNCASVCMPLHVKI